MRAPACPFDQTKLIMYVYVAAVGQAVRRRAHLPLTRQSAKTAIIFEIENKFAPKLFLEVFLRP